MQMLITLLLMATISGVYFWVDERLKDVGSEPQRANLDIAEFSSEINGIGHLGEYQSIVERPLFVESRRLEKEKKIVKKTVRKPVVTQLRAQAIGLAVTGEGMLAVIRDLSNGKTLRLRIDDEIDGWKLMRVSENGFTFVKGDKRKVLNFKNDRG